MICSNCFTFGGVKIDERARVINAEGDAIPGYMPPVRSPGYITVSHWCYVGHARSRDGTISR